MRVAWCSNPYSRIYKTSQNHNASEKILDQHVRVSYSGSKQTRRLASIREVGCDSLLDSVFLLRAFVVVACAVILCWPQPQGLGLLCEESLPALRFLKR